MRAVDHRDRALALKPPGVALPTDTDSNWARLMLALAEELARVDGRAQDLVDEADVRTTFQLLQDWERVTGLPDACTPDERDLQDRRRDLRQRFAGRGGQTPAYYIERALEIGHDITITETKVSIAGVMVAGDELVAAHAHRYAWKVSVPVELTHPFVAGASTAGDRLGYYEPTRLECLIERIKPAHTLVLWEYII